MWDKWKEQEEDPTQLYVPEDSPADLKKKESIQTFYQDQNRKREMEENKKIREAQKNSDMAGIADVAGKIITDYGNSQKSSIILPNRMQDLGKRNDQIAPTENKWNSLQPMFDKKLAEAKQGSEDSFKSMQRDMSMEQADVQRGDQATAREKAAQASDPKSEASKRAQTLARGALLSKVREAEAAGDKDGAASLRAMDVSNMSSAEAKDFYDSLKGTDYKDVLNNQAADRRLKAQLSSQERTATRMAEASERKNAKDSASISLQFKQNYDRDTKEFNQDITVADKMDGFVNSAKQGNEEAVSQLKYLAARLSNGPGVLTDTDLRNAGINQAAVSKFISWANTGASGDLTPKEIEAYSRIGQAARARASRNIQEIQSNYEPAIKEYGLNRDVLYMGQRDPGSQPKSNAFDFDAEDKRRGLK